MMFLVGFSGVAAIAMLLATPKPSRHVAVQAAAMGWTPNRIVVVAWTITCVGVVAGLLTGRSVGGWGASLTLATVSGTWLPHLLPAIIRRLVAEAYRRQRDQKILEWMRKLRLLTSAGQPINAAAVNSALTVSGRAFTVAQGAIGAALEAGRDPLPAVSGAIAGSPAEPLLASVVAAERAGAASSDLLDKSLARSVRTLESECRLAIDKLSRAIGTTVTLVSAIAGLAVMASVIFVL
ncbi:MAG: hypothetical protein F4138_04420 [Acidimicrobiia bacterium]|nr:hypothetical protein [Acidimicrobiia bacterium]